jgi:primosomal protein N' (replication factor Y)
MFIQVRLLKGFPQPLIYEVPQELQQKELLGTIVRVPIQKRIEQALVLNVFHYRPKTNFTIRSITALEQLPHDPHYMPFIKQLATYYQTSELHYLKRIYQFIAQKPINSEETFTLEQNQSDLSVTLTDEQALIVNTITSDMAKEQFTPTVIHGVTGSGKTEVYKKLLLHAYAQQKSSLLLLPEVTLALQFEQLLKQQLSPDIQIYSFHSASPTKDKKLIWQRLLEQKPTIILGVHLPILLPLPNLGVIIVDEEHEVGYQEKKHPKTNSKEAALLRAQLHSIPIVLGSATPSISSLYNVKKRGWQFFQLKKRFAGAFPTIKIVELADRKQRRSFWISQELQTEIKKRLAQNEQVILFLNRRGHSFFVQCKQCSFIFECKNCSVSLTLHNEQQLICHYCGFSQQLPHNCSGCKADEKELIKKGIGTQQLMTIVEKLFPYARVARADFDTSSKKKQWQETVTKFHNREIDILVGTQTITKGYHFPHVTLVGIIWADLNLHFPRYNATETTLQQLIQVAGRAGRQTDHSLVIVQAIAQHHAFSYLKETDYLRFYQDEIDIRSMVEYPPCTRLVEIELKHTHEPIVQRESELLAQQMNHLIETAYHDIKLLGPAKPPISKIKNAHTRVIFLKHESMLSLQKMYQQIDMSRYKSLIFFTPNPL